MVRDIQSEGVSAASHFSCVGATHDSRVCVRSAATGGTVVVRINDRGPFAPDRRDRPEPGRGAELGMVGLGIKPVEL
ncbi:B-cell CLL/lymphoma 9 protein [Manis javanica]|nr:B-cell CLL/lymphoma 9 protein [Manis javanica]